LNKRHFFFPDHAVLKEISAMDICKQARFIPDTPTTIEAGQTLTLTNGEFFIGKTKVEGHWADIRSRYH
jgi:hypothetical protein